MQLTDKFPESYKSLQKTFKKTVLKWAIVLTRKENYSFHHNLDFFRFYHKTTILEFGVFLFLPQNNHNIYPVYQAHKLASTANQQQRFFWSRQAEVIKDLEQLLSQYEEAGASKEMKTKVIKGK